LSNPLRVLGIDPGSGVTGFGVVFRLEGRLVHVAHGNLRPPPGATLAPRLHHLYGAVQEIVSQHRPDVAAVEQVFVAASPRAALVLGQARGAVLAALGGAGIPVWEYAPARIKQALTGSGRSNKREIQSAVRRLLALEATPAADAADALATAICHAEASPLEQLGLAGRRRARRRGPAISVRSAR
jgi:crossover junction endodeoxyribonuclease RuvC